MVHFLRTFICVSVLVSALAPAEDLDLVEFDNQFGPWGMKTPELSVPKILQGKAPIKSAFTVFATGIEVRSPVETVRAYKNLRDIDGFPVHGIWIETQHIRFSPSEINPLVSLANSEGFYTLVRVPTESRSDIQGYIGTGAKGIVVPVVERPEQMQSAFEQSFYSAWREMGFEIDTTNLRKISSEDLEAADSEKTLFFMIESVAGVENLEKLLERAEELCKKYKRSKNQIGFWLGPYDAKVNWLRIHNSNMDGANAWWNGVIPKIAEAVNARGFVIGGHMGQLATGADLVKNRGFKIFTVAGAADSIGNPKVPSLPALFENAPAEIRKEFLQFPPEE